MFVDALDAQMYDEHHSTGHCPLSLSKVICFFKKLVSFVWFWPFYPHGLIFHIEVYMFEKQIF